MSFGKYELNNVYVTDAVKGMKELPDECVDLTVTSPPYDNLRKYSKEKKQDVFDFESIAQELFRITKQGGIVVWIVGDQTVNGSETGTSFRQALYFMDIGFKLYDTMIYAKQNYIPLSHRRYENQFEYMFVFSKGKPNTFHPIMEPCIHSGKKQGGTIRKRAGSNVENADILLPKSGNGESIKEEKMKSNIWFYKVGLNMSTKDKIAFNHPATFPDQLAMDHITTWTNQDDVVFDPLVGSGTTVVMAKKAKRNFLGFDKSEDYIENVAKIRLNQHFPE
jgi:site-specific DNA-methyltransferase (adenine-specific)